MDAWMHGCIDGWMDGWTDGRMDGWTDGWTHGWMGGWMDGLTDGWMNGWMDEWMDGWMDVYEEGELQLSFGSGNDLRPGVTYQIILLVILKLGATTADSGLELRLMGSDDNFVHELGKAKLNRPLTAGAEFPDPRFAAEVLGGSNGLAELTEDHGPSFDLRISPEVGEPIPGGSLLRVFLSPLTAWASWSSSCAVTSELWDVNATHRADLPCEVSSLVAPTAFSNLLQITLPNVSMAAGARLEIHVGGLAKPSGIYARSKELQSVDNPKGGFFPDQLAAELLRPDGTKPHYVRASGSLWAWLLHNSSIAGIVSCVTCGNSAPFRSQKNSLLVRFALAATLRSVVDDGDSSGEARLSLTAPDGYILRQAEPTQCSLFESLLNMSSFMQREMELQIAAEGLAGNEPASPDHNPKKHAQACHASSTPLSQASTAPTTPNMQFRLPSLNLDGFHDEHFPLLTRQLSIPEDEGATFEAPDMFQDISELYRQKYGNYSEEDSACRDDGAPGGTGSSMRRLPSSQESLQSLLTEVKDLYEQKYGTTIDQPQANEELDITQEDVAESDGPVWKVIKGTGIPKDCRIFRLEQKLSEVKKLYELKYGVEIDAEDASVQYDADGTPWVETRGTGSPRDMRLERLEHMLGNVKGLFAQKYGRDVDTEYDADGTPWTVTEGTGVPRDCRVERLEQKLWTVTEGTGVPRDCRVERLEQKLSEVKKLYELKYGVEIDAEDASVQYDADGTPWVETRGTGSPRDMRLERLEHMLGNVKVLFTQKYGRDVDTEYDADGTPWTVTEGTGGLFAKKYGRDVDTEYDADGTPWTVTEGTGVPRDCRMERLEQKLSEVKKLYEFKYDVEIDAEDADVQYDSDGTPWVETQGTGSPRDMRLERLEHMLGNVKGLFALKYGRDVDTEYDADGTPWTVTEGTGVPRDCRTGVPRDCRVERLEQKLSEVKKLYELKYGVEIDAEDADIHYDGDGTPWVETQGTGSPRDMRLERLEQMLGNVKGLFAQKYGRDVDTEYDADGTPWTVTEGTGVPRDCRVERLEQKLSEVKKLYELKYGVEIDAEDADVQYDADGTPWVETQGTGSPRDMRLERLEQMLGNVKGLFAKKYGRDVDTEYDADGTPWTVTEGTGVPRDCRVERLEQKLSEVKKLLEQKLSEVKKLYELKYGVEIDAEDPNVQYDADGTPWVETQGTGSPRDMRLERLEHMLGNVKGLFAQKYGRDVDTEYDADGTPPWTVTEGTGVPRDCRVERLEQKLSEVKKLYELKYGVEIDAEDADVQYDADGTPWVETQGTGSPRDMRLERLEHMLGNVKGLFVQKYGRDVDTEYDADGTPWTVTEGTGVPRDCRVERLEQKLAEVKRLFVARYGASTLTGNDDYDWDRPIDFMYDEDGTLWIKSTTTGGPSRIAAPLDETLEGMLKEVKTLCDKRFGHKPVEDIQSSWSDEDGAPWVQVGSSSSGASTEKAEPFTGTCGLQ
eukprot:s7044_g4.t2